ncbi:MAG: hypothetical protein PUB29_10815 [Bacteroidales bacterium]|nr:hypothetical protein [Bacteroidales bacterium]
MRYAQMRALCCILAKIARCTRMKCIKKPLRSKRGDFWYNIPISRGALRGAWS